MGADSHFREDCRIKAKNSRTGQIVTLVVWSCKTGERHVCQQGGSAMERRDKGRYYDRCDDAEFVTDDPEAP